MARVSLRVAAVEHLHLDPAAKRLPDMRQRIAPNEYARVAPRLHMPPLDLQDKILIHSVGPQRAGRLSRADNHPIASTERARRDVDDHPARKVLAIKQRPPILVGRAGDRQTSRCQRHTNDCERTPDHGFALGIETWKWKQEIDRKIVPRPPNVPFLPLRCHFLRRVRIAMLREMQPSAGLK